MAKQRGTARRGPKAYANHDVIKWLHTQFKGAGPLSTPPTPGALARELNTRGIDVWEWKNTGPIPGPRGGQWSANAVRRVLIEQGIIEKPSKEIRPAYICNERQTETVPVFRGFDKKSGEELWQDVEVTKEEEEALRRETQDQRIQLAALRKLQEQDGSFRFREPVAKAPRKWASGIGELGLAGKDTWDRDVDTLVAELTKNTEGKDPHALIDKVTPASLKGELRTVVWGLLREVALQRQANLALRQRLAERA